MGRDCRIFDDGHGGGRGGAFSSSRSKKTANGCMAAFFHLFDFQHFYFHSHHHLTIDSPSSSKGLKLIEETLPSTTYKDKQSLNIPVSMRVRTETGTKSSRLRALATDTSTSSSEICNSPGSKTPNLVARLMGLDLLPDKTDLNHSLSDLHTMSSHHITSHRLSKKGTRSLPVSPRISSARKSDFDIHRLSLQLNKEKEFGCSKLKQDQEESQEEIHSPRDYARQIVKQIKERVVTRRVVGMDITNSVKNREARPSHELRRDTTVSCSPRTRFSDKENKQSTSHKPNSSSSSRPEPIVQKPKPTTAILDSVSKASGEKQSKDRVKQRQLKPINLCKKAESETKRPINPSPTSDIRNRKREAFLSESRDVKAKPLHKKKFKKIPKSNDLENISATRPPHKQINERDRLISNEVASIRSSLMHKIEKTSPQVARNQKLDDAATGIDSEQDYITRILNLVGIKNDTSTTMLDPSIFHKLEQFGDYPSGRLVLRCNRRLLFDLVNEVLIENVAKKRENYPGPELISELCSAVPRYSSKCCPLPEETALMDVKHLVEKKKLEEEGEEIIAEIEREIIDKLVRETWSELSLNQRLSKTTSVVI
ncbi:predicted protein [Arabidopsis lyrata subsp. lyrata]|uniref:Predicted protein n=1 Tax=Arabidopsis lyrata subsp. lyrata TaxID=81972 RepID=D7MRJ6_ARALL|nr:uncharacterized protein LOC9300213 [Arabidopsis lyrata subsp. lyrata]EFH40396.1 predicted protein [Arabidopsis lyrata subsp. lyrata]|eukprot:XP_002864137.1 uncharacterized protein LOC9300213 [Arabidopsis lyrata subsp. lyrata]